MNVVTMAILKFSLKKELGVRMACFRLATALNGDTLAEFPVCISRAMDAVESGKFDETRLKDGIFKENVFEFTATMNAEKISFSSYPDKVTIKVDPKTGAIQMRMDLWTEASKKIALYGLENFGEFIKVGMQEVQLPLSA